MKRRSLRWKIILLQLTGLVVGYCLFALWVTPHTAEAVLNEAKRHQELETHRIANGMAGILADASNELERIAAEPAIRSFDPHQMASLFEQHGRMSNFFPSMIVADTSGRVITSHAYPVEDGFLLRWQTELAQQALKTGNTQFSQLSLLSTGRLGVFLATPIRDAGRQPLGVLLAPLGREQEPLLQFFANVMIRTRDDDSTVYVIDQHNRLLAHSDYHPQDEQHAHRQPSGHAPHPGETHIGIVDEHWPELPLVPSILEHNGPAIVTDKAADVLATSSPIGETGWRLILQRPLSDALLPTRELTHQLLLTYLLITALGTLLLLGWLQYLLRPISQLAHAATSLRNNDTAVPLPASRNDEIGDLVESFSAMRDNLHARQQALQEAVAFRDRLLDTLHDGLCVVSTDGTLLDVNQAFVGMLGLPRERLIGISAPFPFIPAGVDTPFSSLAAEQDLQAAADIETVIQHVSGEQIPVRARSTPVRNDQNITIAYLMLVRDLRHERRLQQRLVQAEKTAALGRLVAGVAHELNNPLAAVLGYAELLHTDTMLPPEAQDDAARIMQQAQRARRIVQDLLLYGRPQEPARAPVDMHQILRAAVEQQHSALQAHAVEIEWRLIQHPPRVYGDADQLHQVVLNLIQNALQALAHTQHPRRITIATEAQAAGDRERMPMLAVRIQDNGPGIPRETRAHIFEPFFTTKSVGQGTGLGLSIVQSIVHAHDGHIDVESEEGAGAMFTIWLPVVTATLPVEQAVVGESELPRASGQVLIIDDESVIRHLLERVVRRMGYTTVSSASALQAWELMQRHSFDAIICDVRMPELTGPDLFAKVHALHPEMAQRMLFITGDVLNPEFQKFLQEHQLPALAKPFDVDDLSRALETVFERQKEPCRSISDTAAGKPANGWSVG